MNKKPYILPTVSVIKIEIGNILQGSGDTTLNVTDDVVTDPNVWAESRSFAFEEISEEE